MRSVLILLAAAGAGLSSAAFAQDDEALGTVYARAGVGYSFVSDWGQDFTYNPDAVFVGAPLTGQTVENGDGVIAGFALGFDYADGIRTELEYRYASTDLDAVIVDDPLQGPTPATFINDDVTGHFLMSNFYFDFANSSPLTPYIGGGVGGAFIENENAQRDSALAYQGRAGVSYTLGGGLLADLEYVYLRTQKLSFGPDIDDFEPSGPTGPNISGDRYKSSSVMMSLRKHF